ncbi:TIGR03862 family flavoprotein [Limnohabitans sp. MMS-10A-178]|uniref:TIGR03862 family flavoprotein n=1 Tax=Limnohabitans sp. MMS-10A-178 TaxID=1835767 RepID=UPI000D390B88|nr:TIGR03862 family flavoprotein [Limnohabitans sp. MMS-10A-178]PUE15044.1 aminoacetone oxidase family FAD-binding enzyme [Limnohabitans sp. MMS-10A-178]
MNYIPNESPKPQSVPVAVVGGGPAGLMAAQVLSSLGYSVHLFDAMPSVGRKFLLAGRGGLNLTHAEAFEHFVHRYGEQETQLKPILSEWGADQLRSWALALGIDTFVGTSGRVFPLEMKAAPLLRAWLSRLRHPASAKPVEFHMRHRLIGLKACSGAKLDQTQVELTFEVRGLSSTQVETRQWTAQSVVLALGGGSWSRLGSDGAWVPWLQAAGIPVNPLQPSNCGFHVAGREGLGWTPFFISRFAGKPLKSVAMEWTAPLGQISRQQGEFVASSYGVEGSLIYAASADLRKSIQAQGSAEFKLDLLPDWPLDKVVQAVSHPRGSRSLSSHLKGRLGIEGIKMALLNELLPPEVLRNSAQLALAIKGLSIKLTAARPMDEAISTAGGVAWDGLDEGLQTKVMPGVYVAGEMLDWEAPTGGYLLTACMATGYKAALSVHAEIKGDEP